MKGTEVPLICVKINYKPKKNKVMELITNCSSHTFNEIKPTDANSELIVKYIIAYFNLKGNVMNATRTNSMLFIADCYNMKLNGKEMIGATATAGLVGPLYEEITEKLISEEYFTSPLSIYDAAFHQLRNDKSVNRVLNFVWLFYGKYSDQELVKHLTSEYSAWGQTMRYRYRYRCEKTISERRMLEWGRWDFNSNNRWYNKFLRYLRRTN